MIVRGCARSWWRCAWSALVGVGGSRRPRSRAPLCAVGSKSAFLSRSAPSAAYATRPVTQPALAPVSELRHVVVFLKDARRAAHTSRRSWRSGRRTRTSFLASWRSRSARRCSSRTTIPSTTTYSHCRERRRSTSDGFHAASPSRYGDQAGRRQGVLRDSLTHDRDDHGLQPSLVRDVGEDGRRAGECAVGPARDHGVA